MNAHNIILSENAIKQIEKLLLNEPKNTILRLEVEGGGCSGFQYIFKLDNNFCAEKDLIITKDCPIFAIDTISLDLVSNSIVDYINTLEGSRFVLNNPNATSSCGCGSSFSI